MLFGLTSTPEAEESDAGGETGEEEVLEDGLDEFCARLEGETE